MQTVSTPSSLAQQLPALAALAQITTAFPHLPAADFSAGPIYPDRLTISLHDSFTDFETWRTALGIPDHAVEYKGMARQMNLKASGPFAGATVELVGYAPPLPAGTEQ